MSDPMPEPGARPTSPTSAAARRRALRAITVIRGEVGIDALKGKVRALNAAC